MRHRINFAVWVMAAGLLSLAGTAARAASNAVPGSVNYVEGTVLVDGQTISAGQIGSVNLGPNDLLETRAGKAEILLTPGVFLRIGAGSAVKMIRPELADTRLDVIRGQAIAEVAELYKENHISIGLNNSATLLEKTGIYRFDAQAGTVGVVQGEAVVTRDDVRTGLRKNREVQLSAADLKPIKFEGSAEDELYRWSVLRSQYMADASLQSARTVYVNHYPWFGSGWFWNAGFGGYAWLPGNGYFYDPFGFPFFSPGYVTYAPYVTWPHGRLVGGPGGGVRVGAFRGTPATHVSAFRSGAFGGGSRGFSGARR